MLLSKLKLLAKGFCIGSADVVPGVSGGTIAFILGIYPQLINAIGSFDKKWVQMLIALDGQGMIKRPHFAFLIPIGIGAFAAVLFFTRILSLPALIQDYPEFIYSLFFGLILGSIVVLFQQLDRHRLLKHGLLLLLGLLFGGFVVTLVPTSTPDDSWFIFLCGVIAISATILPGISGSFILLMLKKYAYIFDAIGHFQFAIILPFALGIVTGLVLFSRILSYLFKQFYQQTMFFIIGLLMSSLYAIWPFQIRAYGIVRQKERLLAATPYFPNTLDHQLIYSLSIMITGFIFMLLLNKLNHQSL